MLMHVYCISSSSHLSEQYISTQYQFNKIYCIIIWSIMIQLTIVKWLTDHNYLYDYRTERREEKNNFSSLRVQLDIPKTNSKVYYIFHQRRTEDKLQVLIEKRYALLSTFERQEEYPEYVIMGGIQISCKLINQRKKVFVRLVEASTIQVSELSYKQTKSSFLPYWIVRTMQKMNNGHGFKLKPNHRLKLGKTECIIEQLVENLNQQIINQFVEGRILNIDDKIQQSSLSTYSGLEEPKCRICYAGQQHENNMLISACNCKGSIKFIHIECLKEWLSLKISKVKIEDKQNLKIIQHYCCQLCKMNFPLQIIKGGITYNIIRFIENQESFITLKFINENRQAYNICYITFNQESYSKPGELSESSDQDRKMKKKAIGRLEDNSILLIDQTVSRKHCQIELYDQQFYIKDCQSKYGTLIYDPQVEIQIKKGTVRAFQIQSTIFSMKIKV